MRSSKVTARSDKRAAAPREKKWERRSDARPSELVAAALRLFAEKGFAATRLEDVALAAGVSKGTVYLYFENKERLFEAAIRAAITPKVERADALVDAFEGTTPNLLRTILTVFASELDGALPAVVKLIVAESGNFPELARLWVDVAVSRIFLLLRRVIQRGIDRGELRAVNPDEVAPLIMAPVLMLGLWKQTLAPHTPIQLDVRALLVTHAETLLYGIAIPRQEPS